MEIKEYKKHPYDVIEKMWNQTGVGCVNPFLKHCAKAWGLIKWLKNKLPFIFWNARSNVNNNHVAHLWVKTLFLHKYVIMKVKLFERKITCSSERHKTFVVCLHKSKRKRKKEILKQSYLLNFLKWFMGEIIQGVSFEILLFQMTVALNWWDSDP